MSTNSSLSKPWSNPPGLFAFIGQAISFQGLTLKGIMAGKLRKKRLSQVERTSRKVFGEIKEIVSSTTQDRMTMREVHFARLVGCEGYTLSDAYVESHKPQTEELASINTMASRLKAKPRVVREIERLKRQEQEAAAHHEERFKLVSDGKLLREEILKGLYSIATSDAAAKDRSRCWELLGKCRHVDMFAHGSTFSNTTNMQVNNLGVANSNDAGELRSNLVNAIGSILSGVGTTKQALLMPSSAQLIDTKVVECELVEP